MADQQLFRDCTRATQYQTKHALPINFSSIIKDYTREVLREQPQDLLQWSAEYFKHKALELDPACAAQAQSAAVGSSSSSSSGSKAGAKQGGGAAELAPEFEEVARAMTELFSTMDEDGSGRLYVHLVQRALLDHFGLSKEQALYILSSENSGVGRADDGMIDFTDFAHASAQAVVYFQQSGHKFTVTDHASVHGLERDELRDALLRVFRIADSSEGLGRLTFAKFRDALVHAPLQLTQRDLNVLCAEAEQTSDGFVDVRREAEHAFPLLCLSREYTEFDKEHA
jgi:hypothetical protein